MSPLSSNSFLLNSFCAMSALLRSLTLGSIAP